MKRSLIPHATMLLAALACTACAQMPSWTHPEAAQQKPTPAAGTHYAFDNRSCSGVAQKRMAMYDRPDTYPISDREREDAYQALYSACMRGDNWQVAGSARSAVTVAGNDTAQLAALSPAAGGYAATRAAAVTTGNTVVSSTSVPGATVVVVGGGNKDIASQLSSLSPSSGGNASPNATVILVQPPQTPPYPAGNAYYSYRPTPPQAPLPVAVPVAPLTAANTPQAAPKTLAPKLVRSDAAQASANTASPAPSESDSQLEQVLEK